MMKAFSNMLILVLLLGSGFYLWSEKDSDWLSAFMNEAAESDDDDDGDDDDDDELASVDARQQLVQGSLTVKLSTDTQKLAGIKTVIAENITLDAEDKAYAAIIDISPLIDLRSRYRNVNAELEVSRSQLNNAGVVLRRLEKLNAETTNISGH